MLNGDAHHSSVKVRIELRISRCRVVNYESGARIAKSLSGVIPSPGGLKCKRIPHRVRLPDSDRAAPHGRALLHLPLLLARQGAPALRPLRLPRRTRLLRPVRAVDANRELQDIPVGGGSGRGATELTGLTGRGRCVVE